MAADPAFLPFLAMQAVRLLALAAAMAGVAILAGAVEAPQWLAFVLTLAGTYAFFYAPRRIARAMMRRSGR